MHRVIISFRYYKKRGQAMKQLLKVTFTLSLLFSSIGVIDDQQVYAAAIDNKGIASQYQDGRFNTDTLDAGHGYSVGKRTYIGDKVTKVTLSAKGNLLTMYKESDDNKFQKASNKTLENKVWVNRNGQLFMLSTSANYRAIKGFNNNEFFNTRKFNDEIIKLINKDRKTKGLSPLQYRPQLQSGVDVRANELASYGKIRVNGVAHVRLNGERYITAFPANVRKQVAGENSLLSSYMGNPYTLVSERYLAKVCFEQWKKSPSHYTSMMHPKFKGVTSSVKLGKGDGTFSKFVANQNFTYK